MTVEPKLLPLRLRLPYATEEEFIEKYGSNVARGGLFIATRSPKPEGTGLAFELVLANGARLLRGEGMVVKAQVEGAARPGMTVRFARLDAGSKALVDRIVSSRSPSPPAPAPAQAPATPPRASAPTAPRASAPTQAAPGPSRRARPVISAEALRQQATRPAARPATPPQQPRPAPPRQEAPPAAFEPAPPTTKKPAAPAPTKPAAPAPQQRRIPTPLATPEPRPRTPEPLNDAILGHLSSEKPEPSPPVEPKSPPPSALEPSAPARAAVPIPAPEPSAPAVPVPAPEPSAPVREEVPVPAPEPSAPVQVEAPVAPEAPSPEPRSRRRAVLEVPEAPPVTAAPPDVVLGIDLGTSQARVAVHHDGAPRLIAFGEDSLALSSLLAVDDEGQLLVGAQAQAEAGRTPRHATLGLPRLLGLRARSPLLRALGGPLPFPIVAGPHGDACMELGGQSRTVPELAARLLLELKASASAFLGHEASRAVLCVPTHFDERQRAAMREAATLAGLEVLRIINSPSAAALAFGLGRGLARKRLLVIDLGGGGLGVSVVQLTGDDLEVITTGGDATLGGMDFDMRLAEALAEELQRQGHARPEHPQDWVPLLAAAEAAKVALSEREEVPVPLPAGLPSLTLDRERLEALTRELVQRVIAGVRQVLEGSALTPQGLDEVLLLGGQGRSPLVRRQLEEGLGVPVRADVDATGSAALGAALLGQGLLDAAAGKPGATASEVLSLPIGVAERGGSFRRVLERNTRLPTEKTLVLPVTPGPLVLALFQGSSPMALENEYLGTLAFSIERPGEAEVHFSVSADGTLSLAATLPSTRRHPVQLVTHMPEEAELEATLAHSPLEGEPEARPGGLLSGLRKLFGRR